MGSPTRTPVRKPLHERSGSEKNIAAVRLVPATPPQLLWSNVISSRNQRDDIYTRTAFPTDPSHFLPPPDDGASFFQESAPLTHEDCVSAEQRSPKHFGVRGQGSSPTTTHLPGQTVRRSTSTPSSSRPSSSQSSKSLPRKRKHVKVNPDKTFSVLEIAHQDDSPRSDDGLRSPTSSVSQFTHDRLSPSPDGFAARAASGTSWQSETTATTVTTAITSRHSPDLLSKPPVTEDNIPSSSPWNYKLVGGLRKVPNTPDFKQKAPTVAESSPSLPELREDYKSKNELSTKQSFQSGASTSTASDYSNYKVFPSSPPLLPAILRPPSSTYSDEQALPPSSPDTTYVEESTVIHHQLPPSSDPAPSSDPNYEILGQTSPAYSPASSQLEVNSTYSNYELHGDPSPSTSLIHLPTQPRPTYSRESLVVAPLQPRAQRSVERFGYYKKHSRESLRTASLTSITSVLGEDFAKAIATGRQLTRNPSLKNIPESGSWMNPLALNAVKVHMQAHPHQWSSQLSTVASVSDGGTDRNSRQWSEGTAAGRRSSGFLSSSHTHSRQIASINSSRGEERRGEDDFLEWPQPSYALARRDATGSIMRMVEDQDEHGDGITDMPILHERPSRTRLSGFYNFSYNETIRSNSMRSMSSSRANSLLGNTLPTWARLYYGSEERKYLEVPLSLTEGTDSRPNSSFRSGSPDTTNFPSRIYSPRRRPREIGSRVGTSEHSQHSHHSHHSMDITPADPPLTGEALIEHSFKHRVRKPSSVWSPHLALDKRMSRRQSAWQAPSVDWSQGEFSSRRNIQVIMFIVGFIMPICMWDSQRLLWSSANSSAAWMVAAFIPLPPRPELPSMTEADHGKSRLDILEEVNRLWSPMDERRYQSARWWRILNRIFSVVGVAIIVLIVSFSPGTLDCL